MMMPPDELDLIPELTNKILQLSRKKEISFQELLCWFGMIHLMSASIFRGDHYTLREGGGSISKYLPLVDLKMTGAEILGDPYSKKSPLPSIGDFPRLADSPKHTSYQVIVQPRIQQIHTTRYNHSRIHAQ
jgi:hypothetical protein